MNALAVAAIVVLAALVSAGYFVVAAFRAGCTRWGRS